MFLISSGVSVVFSIFPCQRIHRGAGREHTFNAGGSRCATSFSASHAALAGQAGWVITRMASLLI